VVPALSEYPNVYNSVLEVIRAKGFEVWRDVDSGLVYGQKDGWDFAADSPVGLLGLIALWEARSPDEYSEYWWRQEGETTFLSLPTQPPTYTPVWLAG
jgi:hypothetical protein